MEDRQISSNTASTPDAPRPLITAVYTAKELRQAIVDGKRHILIQAQMDMRRLPFEISTEFTLGQVRDDVRSIRVRALKHCLFELLS